MKLNGKKSFFTTLILIALPFAACIPEPAYSQRLIERDNILNPLANPSIDLEEGEEQWFSQVGGWGTFGNYGVQGDADHLWYQQLAAYFELYRKGNETSFAITSQIEFIANDDNDINFSPHAIFWEEGILLTSYRGGYYLQAGYYHRCKHDIDNLERGEERASVFGSAMAGVIIPFSLAGADNAAVSLRYDHYTITWERRIPAEADAYTPKWDQLRFSLTSNLTWEIPVGDRTNLHLNGYGMSTLFDDGFRSNGQLRAEIGTNRGSGDIRFGAHIEYLHDSGIPVRPATATLAGIGIRIMTSGSVR